MTTRSELDLPQLRELARAAYGADWHINAHTTTNKRFSIFDSPNCGVEICRFDYDDVDHEQVDANAAFIAACSPNVILAIVDQCSTLQQRLAEVERERDEARMLRRDAQLQAMDRGASYQVAIAQRDLAIKERDELKQECERMTERLRYVPAPQYDPQARIQTREATAYLMRLSEKHECTGRYCEHCVITKNLDQARTFLFPLDPLGGIDPQSPYAGCPGTISSALTPAADGQKEK